MAVESNAPLVDPDIVGNAFVQKYYNHLYESPAEVHRFYLEDSVLGRPGSDGEMVSVKSLKAIDNQIMSFDYENSKIQILTADSQASYKNGVVTLVTGLLTVKDEERMRFSQSFFLVPQNGSYFVLNDVFRYVADEFVEPEANKEVEETIPQIVQLTVAIAEPANEVVQPVSIPSQQSVVKQATETVVKKPEGASANGHSKTREEKVVNGKSNSNRVDAPKKSFAVIVQSLAQNGGTFNVKASPAKPKPVVAKSNFLESKAPALLPEHPSAETIDQTAEGGSIFVANLPMDATPEQLNETFKGFGTIKKDGIQVRSYRHKGNCFGFVTFESAEAVKLVLQTHKESAIRIGNRRVSIEEKRGNNDNGRSSMRNGGHRSENGYRNDGYRPRGNGFSGGRGYGRIGYEKRGESRNGEANVGVGKVSQNCTVKACRENAQSWG